MKPTPPKEMDYKVLWGKGRPQQYNPQLETINSLLCIHNKMGLEGSQQQM